MHVLVTGAGGFVGAALVQRLVGGNTPWPGPLQLTLVDRVPAPPALAEGVVWHEGSFADPALLARLAVDPPHCVFHLASVPGALAEREPALGLQANLLDTVALFDGLALPARQGRATAPRVVFASSVAVYGELGPSPLHEGRRPQPTLSYGTHKWMAELLLADHSRRGELDGCSLRLPGVVARPPAPSGHGSAFMSQVFHALRLGQPYSCPVSPQATAWWMSLSRCLDNLLHAASLPAQALPASRCWQVPVLWASVAEVVQATARQLGCTDTTVLRYTPDPRIEALFGRQPEVHTPLAEAAGFQHDGSVDLLVARVLADWPPPGPGT